MAQAAITNCPESAGCPVIWPHSAAFHLVRDDHPAPGGREWAAIDDGDVGIGTTRPVSNLTITDAGGHPVTDPTEQDRIIDAVRHAIVAETGATHAN